ncbi:hypothetical protein L1049_002833 [Liquidambar formosana]|uniref:Rx N-terminal domain-containing protein n=1 Tax=Liquidambar formosana TaxID=63359 RepID=A0AAP0R7R0_LIQFO
MGDPISLVVTPIVKKLIDQSSSLIKERYLRVKGLKKDVEELTEHLTTIQYVLEDAEEKQVNDRALKDWLLKLKGAAYDADDLLDVFQTKACQWNKKQQESNFRAIPSMQKNSDKNDIAHKIKKLLERLDKISKEKEKFQLNQLQVNGGRPQTPDRPLTDDLWTVNDEDWESLQRLLKQGGKGSRVLVTSRITTISENLCAKPCYRLSYLPDEKYGQQPSLEMIKSSKKLRAILLRGYDLKNLGQSLDKMFHAMSYVRVLDLSSSTMLTLPKSIEKLELLRYLDLSNTEIKELPNTICNLSNLQTLKLLRCLWLFELPEDLSNLISLRHLELDDMFWNKVLCLGHLPHLRQLYIKGMLDLEEWSTWEAKRPSQLDTLKISNCPNLTKLPPFFPTLRVLKIKNCKSLKALPVVFSLKFLILIDNLALEDWNEVQFKCICNETNQGEPTIRYSFMNLLELKVNGCPKLQALPNVFFPQKLEISECELLTTLPVTEHAQRFQHMALDSCPDGTLVKAIPNSSSLYSLVISNISNLITLPKWPNLPGLKALYIRGCKDLESLAEEEERSFQSLTSLKLLSIRDCPKLVALPKEGLPTALECMTIGAVKLDDGRWTMEYYASNILLSMKKWFDNKSGYVCFELYASEENIEVAKLSHVCWLDVRGKFMISELCAGIVYEIVYVVKLPKGGTGWELPITLRLALPGGNARERQVSLLEKPRGEWIELNVGNFRVEDGENGEVNFDLMEHGGHWKTGLLIKSVIIRPKN